VARIFGMNRDWKTSVAGARGQELRCAAATLLLALSFGAAGCGQKGPLELPKAKAAAPASAPAAAK
jgi:predicted small lipoprotein YifL